MMSLQTLCHSIVTTTKAAITATNANDSDNDTLTSGIPSYRKSLTSVLCKDAGLHNSRCSDSGKSSSCSPTTMLECSFDSGIAGVNIVDNQNMLLHKRIQQFQRILLALERDREHFYILRERLSKLNERNRKKSLDERHFCNVCCTEINPEDVKSFVKCWLCLKSTCRSFKCANWLPKVALWECDLCQKSKESMAQTSSWVAEQFSFNEDKLVYPLRARSEIFIPINECNDNTINFDSVSQIGANSTIITAEQKLKIREYVEEIVSKLLGGNLDTISVNQLSKSENYLSPPKSVEQNGTILSNGDITTKRNYNQNNADFGDISEARLRQMIQKIIAETMSMPPLTMNHAVSEVALDRPSKTSAKHTFKNGYRHRTEHYFEPKIYQDLLATAVLNKIVDTQGNNRIISESTPDLSQSNQSNDMDQNYNVENQSTSSGSSVEPRSDCSYSEMDRILNNQINKPAESPLDPGRESTMSDYLAGHMVPLPDLSNVPTESEEDDFVSITSSAKGEGTWEHNWLFKKKHSSLGGSGTTATILIPIPKEDVRAQIGDKATDEVSDLSELGSETDDSSSGLLSTKMDPLNDRLLNKHIIGGQNSKSVLDELIESSSVPINNLPSEQDETYTDTLNEHVVDAPPKNEAINDEINKIETIDSETERKPSTDQITNEYCSSNNTPTTDEEFIEIGLDVEIEHKQQQSQSNHNNNNNNSNNTYVRLVNNNGNAIPTTTPNTCNKKKNNNGNNNNNHNKNNIDHHYHHYHHNNTTSGREASAVEVTTLKAEQIIIGQNNKIEDYKDDDIDNQILEREHVDDMVAVQPKFVPGSIAEREYLKWHNAVDMPNNPYAPEALKKRINGSQERCMDLPNISPGKEANPLEHITKEKLNDETDNKREIEYKRYSRDYYINNVSKSNESPSKSGSAEQYTEGCTTLKATNNSPPPQSNDHQEVLYKAVPAQVTVADDIGSSIENISQKSPKSANTSTSDDTDTVRIYDFKKQETIKVRSEVTPQRSEEEKDKENAMPTADRAKQLNFNRSESVGRGSTPSAFKFLQPKRRLIDPSHVMSLDEDERPLVSPMVDKPVIEKEVAEALPSVKALAKAFLLSSSASQTSQTEKPDTKKAKISPPLVQKKSIGPGKLSSRQEADTNEDATITSDLSSLDTDPSIVEITKDQECEAINNSTATTTTIPAPSAIKSCPSNTNTVPVREGVLKNNIAFFENLKFK